MALKDTPFGKNLFSMMSLKFQTSGRLDSINTLLGELETNIQSQQSAEDTEYEQTSTAYQHTIDEQISIIAQADTNIVNWGVDLDDKVETHRQKVAQQAALIEEDKAIRDFLAQLAITRQSEVEAYNQRIEDQNAMIAGLEEVIQIFDVEVQNNNELDAQAAQEVSTLLDQILASLRASVAEDTIAENNASGKYYEFVAAQNGRLGEISQELNVLEIEISTLAGEIETLKTDIDNEHIKRSEAITLRDSTISALNTLTENYNANKQVRHEQLSLIQQVRSRLNENPEQVQQFLNGA